MKKKIPTHKKYHSTILYKHWDEWSFCRNYPAARIGYNKIDVSAQPSHLMRHGFMWMARQTERYVGFQLKLRAAERRLDSSTVMSVWVLGRLREKESVGRLRQFAFSYVWVFWVSNCDEGLSVGIWDWSDLPMSQGNSDPPEYIAPYKGRFHLDTLVFV